jgi:hypothetical protein
MEAALSEHREHENLKATLMTAQRLADDIRTRGAGSQRIIRRPKAAPTCCSTRRRLMEDIQREIDGLKLKRKM